MTDVTISFMEMAERAFQERDALREKVSRLTAENAAMRKALEPNFTFDDSHFGRSDNQRISLTEKMAARPEGLDGLDWYHFAGKLADALNALATPPDTDAER